MIEERNMKTIVFLDDERNPEDVTWMPAFRRSDEINWIVVRNYAQFTALVKSLSKEQLEQYQWSFDHDLQDFVNDREYTGKHCLQYLLDVCTYAHEWIAYPTVYWHTQNPVGRESMSGLYNAYVSYRAIQP